jgi:phosphoribosylformylglycinamidine synthase
MGLAFDDWDLEYYTKLFTDMGRDPTNVELFDIAQSNSEHSRHWFFKGDLVIDGKSTGENLMDVVRAPLEVRGARWWWLGGGGSGGGGGKVC